MKCFICGNISDTLPVKEKVLIQSFRNNIKNFCSDMYEDFLKAKQPDVCVNCHKVVQNASNFKNMVIQTRKIITKTWFECDRNKIDLLDIFGNFDANENQLNHVFIVKDECPPNSPEGSISGNLIALEEIFCINDPGIIAQEHYLKEQNQASQMDLKDKEDTPKKVQNACRRQSIGILKKHKKYIKKRWMLCSLCDNILEDARILRDHVEVHAK